MRSRIDEAPIITDLIDKDDEPIVLPVKFLADDLILVDPPTSSDVDPSPDASHFPSFPLSSNRLDCSSYPKDYLFNIAEKTVSWKKNCDSLQRFFCDHVACCFSTNLSYRQNECLARVMDRFQDQSITHRKDLLQAFLLALFEIDPQGNLLRLSLGVRRIRMQDLLISDLRVFENLEDFFHSNPSLKHWLTPS